MAARSDKWTKEQEAVRQREEAKQYLERMGVGPLPAHQGEGMARAMPAGADNTVDMVRARRAAAKASTLKDQILRQQQDFRDAQAGAARHVTAPVLPR